MLEVIIIL